VPEVTTQLVVGRRVNDGKICSDNLQLTMIENSREKQQKTTGRTKRE
jgi:hypothetical protein